jgi:hypothetical protein
LSTIAIYADGNVRSFTAGEFGERQLSSKKTQLLETHQKAAFDKDMG